MAKNYKIIAQASPAATTDTTLYTVPSSTQVSISSITICNRAASTATYRIAMRPNAETLADKHYIAYGATVPANDTIALTLGLTADAADVITVYASTASVSFGVFGSEIV
jgi:DNA polymerase III sliding clamp (beta) subunit (PCNA family)